MDSVWFWCRWDSDNPSWDGHREGLAVYTEGCVLLCTWRQSLKSPGRSPVWLTDQTDFLVIRQGSAHLQWWARRQGRYPAPNHTHLLSWTCPLNLGNFGNPSFLSPLPLVLSLSWTNTCSGRWPSGWDSARHNRDGPGGLQEGDWILEPGLVPPLSQVDSPLRESVDASPMDTDEMPIFSMSVDPWAQQVAGLRAVNCSCWRSTVRAFKTSTLNRIFQLTQWQ